MRTSWTKRPRGGEAAARGNAVPVGFRVPPMTPGVAHVVRMHECHGFDPFDSQDDLRKVDVQLREDDGRLRVLPQVPGTGRRSEPCRSAPPRRRRAGPSRPPLSDLTEWLFPPQPPLGGAAMRAGGLVQQRAGPRSPGRCRPLAVPWEVVEYLAGQLGMTAVRRWSRSVGRWIGSGRLRPLVTAS